MTPYQCRAARRLIGPSREELASALGTSVATITAFEIGATAFSEAKRNELRDLFEVAGVVVTGSELKLRKAPAQCRAARGIAFMTQSRLAEVANVPRNVIIDFELNALRPKPAYLEAMRRVLEERGVEFIDGEAPSVRLRI
jgi:transcriptional regulator with XRE-family HTH domain